MRRAAGWRAAAGGKCLPRLDFWSAGDRADSWWSFYLSGSSIRKPLPDFERPDRKRNYFQQSGLDGVCEPTSFLIPVIQAFCRVPCAATSSKRSHASIFCDVASRILPRKPRTNRLSVVFSWHSLVAGRGFEPLIPHHVLDDASPFSTLSS